MAARLFWNERSARLKLVMPVGASTAEYEVPGGSIRRGELGEVPGGRWVRALGSKIGANLGFASDALYGFDLTQGDLRATLVRASRYANDVKTAPDAEQWMPATDVGEHRFRFVLSLGGQELPRLAAELEMPPVAVTAAPHPGELPRTGSLAALKPEAFQLLAVKPAQYGRGWIVRVLELAGKDGCPELVWLGSKVELDTVEARSIASWRLLKEGDRWHAERVTAQE